MHTMHTRLDSEMALMSARNPCAYNRNDAYIVMTQSVCLTTAWQPNKWIPYTRHSRKWDRCHGFPITMDSNWGKGIMREESRYTAQRNTAHFHGPWIPIHDPAYYRIVTRARIVGITSLICPAQIWAYCLIPYTFLRRLKYTHTYH